MASQYQALATDYDGTIAHHGSVAPSTIAALSKARENGHRLLLVTGREVPDLKLVFSELALFDLIVAENGALLFDPAQGSLERLCPPPPVGFAARLRELGVNQISIGEVIVATQESYVGVVEKVIGEMRLPLQIILNKGAVMVLPQGVDKGTGLKAALIKLGLMKSQVIGVGDAENDNALLQQVGLSAAVSNALPELKKIARIVLEKSHGCGVEQLIEKWLGDKLPAF